MEAEPAGRDLAPHLLASLGVARHQQEARVATALSQPPQGREQQRLLAWPGRGA
jgi:hypothetical protein